MKDLKNINKYYTPKQLKLPIEIERIIEVSDPVYSFTFERWDKYTVETYNKNIILSLGYTCDTC